MATRRKEEPRIFPSSTLPIDEPRPQVTVLGVRRSDEPDGQRGYVVFLGITSEMPSSLPECQKIVRDLGDDFWGNADGILDGLGIDWRGEDPPKDGEMISWNLAICFWDEEKGEPRSGPINP